MGMCTSCEAAAVASTAKLILPDGRLQEHGGLLYASDALGKEAADLFLCNADDMEFGGYVSAVGPDEMLQPGQIYFALPRSMLRRKLRSEDMAALAVRASSALAKKGAAAVVVVEGGCGAPQGLKRGVLAPMCAVEERRRKEGGGDGRGRGFASDLTVIPE